MGLTSKENIFQGRGMAKLNLKETKTLLLLALAGGGLLASSESIATLALLLAILQLWTSKEG